MALKPSRFKLDEEISLGGKPMRVAGLLQFEDGAEGKAATRYLLAGSAGVPQILEESGGSLLLLRPFPPAAQIQPSGDTVTVMGTPYKLATLRKLKVLGTAGEAPGGAPAGPLVLSGIFQGGTGALLREIVPGKPGHVFYSVKQLPATDVLSAQQLAEQQEGERLAAAQRTVLAGPEALRSDPHLEMHTRGG